MTFEQKLRIIRFDALSVIDDSDLLHAGLFDIHLYFGCVGIK